MGFIYLIRHGEVAWNYSGAYVGVTDLQLNDVGLAQAHLLSDYLVRRNIAAVYSSDLQRARVTAEIIAEPLGLPVHRSIMLREINYGEWEGLTSEDISNRYGELYHKWISNAADIQIPGGETFRGMLNRSMAEFTKITDAHEDENIAVVAHKSVNRVIICQLLGMDINNYRMIGQVNSCFNIIQRRKKGDLVVQTINNRCHLADFNPGSIRDDSVLPVR